MHSRQIKKVIRKVRIMAVLAERGVRLQDTAHPSKACRKCLVPNIERPLRETPLESRIAMCVQYTASIVIEATELLHLYLTI